jgi:hypothetical protein
MDADIDDCTSCWCIAQSACRSTGIGHLYYGCSAEKHVGLAQMYLADERSRATTTTSSPD